MESKRSPANPFGYSAAELAVTEQSTPDDGICTSVPHTPRRMDGDLRYFSYDGRYIYFIETRTQRVLRCPANEGPNLGYCVPPVVWSPDDDDDGTPV